MKIIYISCLLLLSCVGFSKDRKKLVLCYKQAAGNSWENALSMVRKMNLRDIGS